MPTILQAHEQDPGDRALMRDVYTYIYLHGSCYAFAIALHEGLGWPIVGLIKEYGESSKCRDVIWHVGVRAPDGMILDVRGFLTEQEFGNYYLPSPHMIRDVPLDELRVTSYVSIQKHTISMARRLAESFWPELPWIDSLNVKVKAFADELEALSRKHGFWICGGVPADPPRLYRADGEEGGYRIQSTIGGLAYTITRYFPVELHREETERILKEIE